MFAGGGGSHGIGDSGAKVGTRRESTRRKARWSNEWMERSEATEGAKRRNTTGWVRARDLDRERATAASRMEGRRVAHALRREEKKPTVAVPGRAGE
uniref:Uncharacterized protein n=1 Tax=Aegilops tauschii TaxID=37682 RepID=M8BD04_AEGTA